ncbi:hypothetical protein N2152v2_010204 [Parachlorella kessleri]
MPTTLGESSLWDLGAPLEPLESFLASHDCLQESRESLLLEQGLDLFLSEESAADAWLFADVAGVGEPGSIGAASCPPLSPPEGAASMGPPALHPGQPLAQTMPSHAAVLPSLSSGDSLGIPTSPGTPGGLEVDIPVPSSAPEPAYNSLLAQQQQQEQQQQQAAVGGSLPKQSRGRGRPRADRSQMTRRQLKAIQHAQAHSERKKSHMRELEERVAEVRADLERERAQQEAGQRAIGVLERLLSYRDGMIAALEEHGRAGGGTEGGKAGQRESPGHAGHLALATAADGTCCRDLYSYSWSSCNCGRCCRGRAGLLTLTVPPSLPRGSWVHKLPATRRFVEHVLKVQLPAMQAGEWPASCGPAQFQRLQQQQQQEWHEGQRPATGSLRHQEELMYGPDAFKAICATAAPEVVEEVRTMDAADIVEGWRDYARECRDIVAEYDVTQNEAAALSRMKPHMERLGIFLNLAFLYNKGLMAYLYLASADNLSDEQQREKYDVIVAAMDITPSQQERYLELADAYTSFVQQARQHKSEAVARIAKGAFSSLPATASMGRMVSGYLEALEGAAMLESYPDAETTAIMQLSKGMAKIYRPLQKARGAAMAYPQFMDVLHIMESIKRLPPPEQRKQELCLRGQAEAVPHHQSTVR